MSNYKVYVVSQEVFQNSINWQLGCRYISRAYSYLKLNFCTSCKLYSGCLLVFIFTSFVMIGCTSYVEKYIQTTPQLSPAIVLALRNQFVINGMTYEEVRLVLGKPSFIEKKTSHKSTVRWVYRHSKGVRTSEVYNPLTSFPQGIGYVIPLNYKGKEVRIDFQQGKVYRVENILSF